MSEQCVKHECEKADLIWMEKGQSMQTGNGFLIAKVWGWYCPKCAAGYGDCVKATPLRKSVVDDNGLAQFEEWWATDRDAMIHRDKEAARFVFLLGYLSAQETL